MIPKKTIYRWVGAWLPRTAWILWRARRWPFTFCFFWFWAPLCAFPQSKGLDLPILRDTSKPAVRVIIVHDPEATAAFQPRPDKVLGMVNRGVTTLTGKSTPAAAWGSLVSTQDVIGIKVYSA